MYRRVQRKILIGIEGIFGLGAYNNKKSATKGGLLRVSVDYSRL
jgi:hypothetical protein